MAQQGRYHVPVPDTLRAQQDRIIEVHVRLFTIADRLSSVEDKRKVKSELFDALCEFCERLDVVDERLQDVFVADKVKAWLCMAAWHRGYQITLEASWQEH